MRSSQNDGGGHGAGPGPLSRREFVRVASLAGAVTAVLPAGRAAEAETPAAAPAAAAAPKPTGVALLGCAHIHTPTFVAMMKGREDVRIRAVYDAEAAPATALAQELETQAVRTPQEALADAETAAVVICSETVRHRELVEAAAAAGKHLFVEKPLGGNGADALAMAAAVEKAGRLFSTGYTMRTSAAVLGVRELLATGAFGQVTRAASWFCHEGALTGMFDTPETRWVTDPKLAGVGAFGDIGTHALDLLMWLFGEVESVSADVREVTGRHPGCDELGQALLRFRSGVLGTVTGSWVDVANPVTLMVCGTEAHAVILNNSLYLKCAKLEGADGKRPWQKLPKGLLHPLHLFLDAVGGKPDQPLVAVREAARRVVVMDAMYQSARENRRVPVA